MENFYLHSFCNLRIFELFDFFVVRTDCNDFSTDGRIIVFYEVKFLSAELIYLMDVVLYIDA